MSSVPPHVLDRLRKIAGLLGSEHAGERAAAAAKANEILARHKITWADVVMGEAAGPRPFTQSSPPPPPPPPPPADEPDWQDADPTPVPVDIPTEQFTDSQLRACASRAVDEDARGLYDLEGTDFLQDVGPMQYWSPRQRTGLVRSLRRAWVIRRKAGLR